MTASIRYMGSKRSLAPCIADLISAEHPGAKVVDAFAGMCAVGSALSSRHCVIANDVHAFATTVARALLVAPGEVPTMRECAEDIFPVFLLNWRHLYGSLEKRILEEKEALARVAKGREGWRHLQEFTEKELSEGAPLSLEALPSIADYRENPSLSPYALFSMCFASTYLGVKQAAVVDSLRFAIDCAPLQRRDFYMLALLQATSHCAAAPGHFAQFLVPRTERNTKYIARMRRRSVWGRFREALCCMRVPVCVNRAGNAAFCSDATEFVSSGLMDADSLVIYADPPYSRAQYSRYYHVLESLVLYDYPAMTGKGRYRVGRLNTDFSRAAQVLSAMDQFVAAAASTGAPLYLSYPKNGLVFDVGGDILCILRRHYGSAEVVISKSLAHSTLGGAPGTAAINVTEDVYYAF